MIGLSKLKEMLERATPAPWEWDWGHSDNLYGDGVTAKKRAARERDEFDSETYEHTSPIIQTDSRVYGPEDADAELIVALRNGIPAIIAEFERMQAALLEIASDPCLDPEGNKQIAKRGLGLDPHADVN